MSEESISDFLKKEREKKGISLEEIAQKTKISLNNLNAIESGAFEKVPSNVFIKGYIINYTEAIGLSSDEILERFNEEIKIWSKSDSFNGDYSKVLTNGKKHLTSTLLWILILIILVSLGLGLWYDLIHLPHF